MQKLKIFWLISLLLLTFAVQGQKPQTVKSSAVTVKDLKLNSRLMGRAMPYKIVLPNGYELPKTNSTVKPMSYPVIYLLHGLTGHYDNWVNQSKLTEYAANYGFIIVTPEGDNGWYTDSATVSKDKYESYIMQELIPEIEKNYRTIPDRQHRFIAGLSMGGYGSLKFGLKFPDKFVLVGSFSGALGAASWTEKNTVIKWKVLTDSIMSTYGAENSPTRMSNDIYKIAREMPSEKIKTLPFFYLDCGTEDGLVQSNREFAGLLIEKKIPHEFRELPGKHDWIFWDAQVQEFLRLADKYSRK